MPGHVHPQHEFVNSYIVQRQLLTTRHHGDHANQVIILVRDFTQWLAATLELCSGPLLTGNLLWSSKVLSRTGRLPAWLERTPEVGLHSPIHTGDRLGPSPEDPGPHFTLLDCEALAQWDLSGRHLAFERVQDKHAD